MQSKIIPSSEVKVGDKVTEMDTPEGPFYDVVRETAKSYWIRSAEVELRFGKSPRMGVRRVV